MALNVLACAQPEAATLPLGEISPAAGRASIAFCAAAIKAAVAGEVDAVAAAPQHETSIAQAGIAFDGHPSFVARQTGMNDSDVYMMLCFGDTRIAHATLHTSVRQAIEEITRERVLRVIRVADRTLRSLGIGTPRIAVSGLNPHAGEGGLFGREEIEIIKPAIEAAAAEDSRSSGPFGADTMFHMAGIDAFVVMLHDQGHIAAKLLAQNAAAALSIGSADPVLLGRARHRPRHRRQGHRQPGGHDRSGAAAVEGKAGVHRGLKRSRCHSGAREARTRNPECTSSERVPLDSGFGATRRPGMTNFSALLLPGPGRRIGRLDAAGILDQFLDRAGDRQRQPGLVGHLGDDLHVLQRPGEA